jgi:hypothetical protein
VCRRHAGRRHYNAVRQFQRAHRRLQVVELLGKYNLAERCTRARIARELHVSRSVITRDLQALLHTHAICPTCGSAVPQERLAGRPQTGY